MELIYKSGGPTMPSARANAIEIEYETFGESGSSPLLLIMGLGGQLIRWPEVFCQELADRDHYVIRFDNRDTGLSSKIDEAGVPNIMEIITASARGGEIEVPYTLTDMADDAIGLLDALGIEKAHLCGVSMGGMIAQTMAIRYPSRVLSLISMESSTGDPELPNGRPEAMSSLMTPAPTERNAYIDHMGRVFTVLAGGSSLFDEGWEREKSADSFDRCYHPQGVARQLAAVIASGSRKEELGSVTAPSLVIHGSLDPLVPLEHGRATAEAIPGAELLIIDDLGHGLSFPALWPKIVDAITEHIHKAEG
jgi:pimeloyl-ACP methyl ester carboxylesterase